MAATALIAAALLAQSAPSLAAEPAQTETVDVGYQELRSGAPAAVIAKIEANADLASDPAALINLGNAYARLGETAKALQLYRAAAASDTRYDLELADGRWMDSRLAARRALGALQNSTRQALRN